jgi:DNA-binding NtrC family response regulator
MRDETLTQTGIDPSAAARPLAGVIGVVVVFSELSAPAGAFGVSTRRCIGREATADILLVDPRVSRLHAELEVCDGGVLVTDLSSHNGTFVDGVRLSEPRVLARIGSTLRVGKTLLRVVGDVRRFRDLPRAPGFPLVGGPSLQQLRQQILRIGTARQPVLVCGETGTGKELVARALHDASGRPGKLVTLNCATLPADLVESELFGHAKGAFSGSQRPRAGLFRTAHQGTLLLDEIGELDLPLQAKLLRVVEEAAVRPVGVDEPVPVDVRIVAATHRDLDALVQAGSFRADLLHRLAATRLVLPPLRERIEDIPDLVEHFLGESDVRCSAVAMERLFVMPWPGNVRELRNVVQDAAMRARDAGRDRIQPEDLPATPVQEEPLEELRTRLEAALTRRRGNAAQVARDLGWHRSRLYEAFTRLGIDLEAYREP